MMTPEKILENALDQMTNQCESLKRENATIQERAETLEKALKLKEAECEAIQVQYRRAMNDLDNERMMNHEPE